MGLGNSDSASGGGVAALMLLAANARRSGVVVEGVSGTRLPGPAGCGAAGAVPRIEGRRRIVATAGGSRPYPWSDRPAFDLVQARIEEARRDRDRLTPLALEATTPAGVLAKSRVVLELFALNGNGQNKVAVAALVEDLVRVLGQHGATA